MDTTLALWACSHAIRLKPDEAGPWHLRGRLYAGSLSLWEEAAADFSEALKLKKDDWHLWRDLGDAHSRLLAWRLAVGSRRRRGNCPKPTSCTAAEERRMTGSCWP
jgi:hypothetical protein